MFERIRKMAGQALVALGDRLDEDRPSREDVRKVVEDVVREALVADGPPPIMVKPVVPVPAVPVAPAEPIKVKPRPVATKRSRSKYGSGRWQGKQMTFLLSPESLAYWDASGEAGEKREDLVDRAADILEAGGYRPVDRSARRSSVNTRIGFETHGRLKAMAAREGVSMAALVDAGFQALRAAENDGFTVRADDDETASQGVTMFLSFEAAEYWKTSGERGEARVDLMSRAAHNLETFDFRPVDRSDKASPVGTRITPSMHGRLKAMAREKGVSMTALIDASLQDLRAKEDPSFKVRFADPAPAKASPVKKSQAKAVPAKAAPDRPEVRDLDETRHTVGKGVVLAESTNAFLSRLSGEFGVSRESILPAAVALYTAMGGLPFMGRPSIPSGGKLSQFRVSKETNRLFKKACKKNKHLEVEAIEAGVALLERVATMNPQRLWGFVEENGGWGA